MFLLFVSDRSMRISADEEIRDADAIFAQLSEKCDRNIAQLKQQLERMKSYQPNVVSHDELVRGRPATGQHKSKQQLSKASLQKPGLNKHQRDHHTTIIVSTTISITNSRYMYHGNRRNIDCRPSTTCGLRQSRR